MGADAFLFLGGQTSVWGQVQAKEYPFSGWMLRLSEQYGEAAREEGLRYGVYLTTFRVVGDAWEKAPYRFTLSYNREKDALEPIDFISFKDGSRQQQLVDVLKKLQGDDTVDMVGFDYIRTGEGAYEHVDEFVADMDIETPPGWADWPSEARSLWLARRIERHRDKKVLALFEWWRARLVAETLKDILARARVTKPVFTFTLGWEMGHQHGQDPAMLIDAGVGVNNIMLYQRNRGNLEAMKRHWPPYLSQGNGMFVLGEMVDFNWVQRSVNPPAPEELYNREVETFENWLPANAPLGMYWHDLYRLVYGAKGPYSTVEWALSGAKAFTFLRQAQDVTPILTRIDAPKEVPAGVPFTFSVEVLNRSDRDLRGLTLKQFDPNQESFSVVEKVGPFDLPAGHRTTVSGLRAVSPKDPHPERDNRWMLALLVEKRGSREARAFDFAYVKALTPDEARERLDVVKAYKDRADAAAGSSPRVERPIPDRKLAAEKRKREKEKADAAALAQTALGQEASGAATVAARPPASNAPGALAPGTPSRPPTDLTEILRQVPDPDF
jgi:hypothetical protein